MGSPNIPTTDLAADNEVIPTYTESPETNGHLPDNPPSADDKDTELAEYRCGYGTCRPDCLQAANNTKGLLACMCLFTFVEGFLVNGINNINVSSLERRFDLSSASVAWVSSAYDLSAAVTCLVLGYLGLFAHKGKILTITATFMCVGAFVMFLPHLVVGKYQLGEKVSDECSVYGNLTRCADSTQTDDSSMLFVLIAGMVLVGVGGSSVYLVGATWLDDNLAPQDTPMYLGIMHTMAALGPAVGFIAGGTILDEIYVDAEKPLPDDLDIDKTDPRWVGAWWIGYLISSLMSVFVILLVACFPRLLPASVRNQDKRQSQAYRGMGDQETDQARFGRSWKDIGVSLRITFTNPPWIFVTIAGILESGAVVAFNTFLPKMFQFQFSMTAGMGAILAGAAVIPGAAIGQLLGGLIPKWAKLKVRGLFIQCGICSIIAGLAAPILLLRCDMPKIAGVTRQYINSTTASPFLGTPALEDQCNWHCNCTSRSYEPICGSGDVEYFSPCHAGCLATGKDVSGGEQMYKDCSCIDGVIYDDVTPISQWEAEEGICGTDCSKLKLFMPVFMILVLATFISNTAGHAAVIRCVPDKNRSFAYGIQTSIVRLLGHVPGPVILGAIFDQSCLVWKDSCGSRGSCWIYDNAALSWRLFLIAVIVNAISGMMFFLAAIVYRAPKEEEAMETEVNCDDKSMNTREVTMNETSDNRESVEAKGDIVVSTRL